jgi:hypothetical protein
MDRHRDSIVPPSRALGLFALAGALIALSGHLELIRRFGTALPFRDQWKCTGQDLLGRWAEGNLSWRHFFEPLNDHWPVLTRALSFMLTRLNGQWNNLVETTCNALLYAVAVFVFLRMILPALGRGLGGVFAIGAGVVLALPVTWENTLWGIQSLVYLQILLSLIYLASIASRDRFDAGWILGQLAGLLVLLTQHSGVLAHAAAVPLLAWRLIHREGRREITMANLAIAMAIIAGFFALIPAMNATAHLRADSWRIALDVALRQLAWPIAHPGGALLIYLPWIFFTLDRVARRRLSATDAFIIAAGFWVGAQAAAIGYGRGADTAGFVSRYCDFLALGLLLNGACLLRLWQATATSVLRFAVLALALGWLGTASRGLWLESRYGHAGYNLSRRNAVNAENLQAVRDYITTRDPGHLSRGSVADTLYTYPPAVRDLLENARFRSLLPPETGAVEARSDQGRIGLVLGWLPSAAPFITGLGLALATAVYGRSRKAPPPALPALETSTWTGKKICATVGVLSLISTTLVALWPGSLEFQRGKRWTNAFAPPVPGVTFVDLNLRSADSRNEISPAAPQRAVATIPAEMRMHWYGTLLGGSPEFQGVLRGSDFEVRQRYLFVPVTGWPSWSGNGLRWRFVDPKTNIEQWVSFVAPNPVDGVAIWQVDAAPFLGKRAALFLYDGGPSQQNWLGVARPAATDNPAFGRTWISLIHAERAEDSHQVIAWFALGSTLVFAGLALWLARERWLSHWRHNDDLAS